MEEHRSHDRRQTTLRVVYDRRLTNLGPPNGIERRRGEDRREADRRIAERRLILIKPAPPPTGTE
jgi:hypothetical protein